MLFMRHYTPLLVVMLFCYSFIYGQNENSNQANPGLENINATGGDASSADGSVAYSIGTVFYTQLASSSGGVSEGVQNPEDTTAQEETTEEETTEEETTEEETTEEETTEEETTEEETTEEETTGEETTEEETTGEETTEEETTGEETTEEETTEEETTEEETTGEETTEEETTGEETTEEETTGEESTEEEGTGEGSDGDNTGEEGTGEGSDGDNAGEGGTDEGNSEGDNTEDGNTEEDESSEEENTEGNAEGDNTEDENQGEDGIIYQPLEQEILNVVVFPNPTVDVVTIDIESFNNDFAYYELCDQYGRELERAIITAKETTLTLGQHSTAIYLLTVVMDNKMKKTFKLIKN